ncbi:MAG TPA: hypothetical protein VNO32_58915 [Candidatus Acidoferrum sp.]|nr:hypothetical protein [Candidatus Acidoferrum sp.]
MILHLVINLALALASAANPSSAANGPQVGTDRGRPLVWTNDDLEKLHDLDLISIVGQVEEEEPTEPSVPESYVNTQDPGWYAEQAANLRDELENSQAQLREFQRAIDDARSLRQTTGEIGLDYGDVGITPDDAIENLQQHVNDVRADLDALGDLARQNGIPPGVLRGQEF